MSWRGALQPDVVASETRILSTWRLGLLSPVASWSRELEVTQISGQQLCLKACEDTEHQGGNSPT